MQSSSPPPLPADAAPTPLPRAGPICVFSNQKVSLRLYNRNANAEARWGGQGKRESMCVSVRVCECVCAYAKGRKTVINFHHLTKTKLQDSVSKSWGKCFSIIHEYRHVCYQPLGPDVFRLGVGGKVQRGRRPKKSPGWMPQR